MGHVGLKAFIMTKTAKGERLPREAEGRWSPSIRFAAYLRIWKLIPKNNRKLLWHSKWERSCLEVLL